MNRQVPGGMVCTLITKVPHIHRIISAYELWFKQILFEIDSVREIFLGIEQESKRMEKEDCSANSPVTAGSPKRKPTDLIRLAQTLPDAPVDESKMLEIINRMQRVAMILKVLLVNRAQCMVTNT